MKHPCLNCEQAEMVKETKDVTVELHSLSCVVHQVSGWHCPQCGDIEFTKSRDGERIAAALAELSNEWEGIQRRELTRIRKKLKLTQQEAAQLAGGGKNAFSRYERGEAKPVAAVMNLFRLLDHHPELLRELRDEKR